MSDKDINITLVVIWGTIVAMIIIQMFAAISDYMTSRLGRRRPFLIIGIGPTVLVLLTFAFAPT